MEVASREATTGDVAVVAALLDMALAEAGESKGGAMYLRREARQEATVDVIANAVAIDGQLVTAGTLDDVIVGFATTQLESLPDGASIAEVKEVYVLPEARGVGVGEYMLDAVREWATGHGCVRLESSVLPGNRAGKNFFERATMVTRLLRVSTSLEPAVD